MPTKRLLILITFVLCVMITGGMYLRLRPTPQQTNPDATSSTLVRIGWQTPWATQGQLIQILKHTDILQRQGLQPDFKGFSYGGPLNEAALGQNVDVILTADQPIATLLSKNPQWVIIGRLMYNRVSLYVPPQSSIQTTTDLKGKTVGMPIGAAAQRFALRAETDANLAPEKDVKNINLAMEEQAALLQDPRATTWGSVDALAGFDPAPAIFEERGLIRTLATGKVVSVIAVSESFLRAHPLIGRQLRDAFGDAYLQYTQNPQQANTWFRDEARLAVSDAALAIAASIEPNVDSTSAPQNIRMKFTDEDIVTLQQASDFLYSQGLTKQRVDMASHVDSEAKQSSNAP